MRRRLYEGDEDKRVFVSTLFAQRWLDLEDLQPEDLVLQIVRQLVTDLGEAGMPLGEKRFTEFLRSLTQKVRGVQLEKAEVGLQPLKFSFALQDFPTARDEFREVLRGQLPTVFDLVNKELLPAAREHVRGNGGYDDILLIVDDLDKIPQKILANGRVTNHENLFLDNAATLRAITCSLLLTVPIELAYSPAQGRLRDDYGALIVTVPLISIADREGNRNQSGEDAMIEILGRRAQAAFGGETSEPLEAAMRIFSDEDLLRRVVCLSGGHVRSLLVLVTELLDWIEELPITETTVSRYIPRAAKDLARALSKSDRLLLKELEASGEPPEDPRFWDLVRNHYVFAYEAGDEEYWYGLNPLIKEIGL
ncbi:MAG TPA: hypothetical protein VFJ65_07175 [Solirubrobacterales bacterium]|nr:hypothetical protein [Solirubrobacterales bacterium]